MAFLDEVVITLASGHGGAGCMSFRREKYLPRGGPDGGDGGRGGHVILVANQSLNTFQDALGGSRRLVAGRGQQGGSRRCHGKDGVDLRFQLPVGTILRDAERGHTLAELTEDGQEIVFLKGGKGGRGNWSFRSARRQAPRISQDGLPGEERRILLELKLLADVGLVGLPNAGKSTLLAHVTHARPAVGHYPFTTLRPRIGTVEYDYEVLTMADLPGLLEGAHEGKGLGDRFLRHIERTRVLLHLVDASTGGVEEWEERYRTVRAELDSYGIQGARRDELVVLTKVALADPPVTTEGLSQRLGVPVLSISAVEGVGLEELVPALFRLVGPRP